MIGLISAAIGLGSAIYGGIKSAKAKKEQKRNIADQQAREDAYYNNEYYKDYMDSTMARSALKRVQNTMERVNRESRANSVLTGATPEMQVAQQQAANKTISDAVENLAARGDARRDSIAAQHQARLSGIDQQKIQQSQMDEAGAAQVANNGISLLGSALSLYDKPIQSPSDAVGAQSVTDSVRRANELQMPKIDSSLTYGEYVKRGGK